MTAPARAKDEGAAVAEVVRAKRETALSTTDGPSIHSLMEKALDHGESGVAALERLVSLQEHMLERQAKIDMAQALADFQSECPLVPKSSRAKIATKGGSTFEYSYASLDTIVATIRPMLTKYGLSFTWDSVMVQQMLNTTCTLRHTGGAEAKATFSAPTDSRAGMSEQQKHAAALSFGRRQSLVQVLGLTTVDPDTDAVSVETISADQQANIETLMTDAKVTPSKFLGWLGVKSIEEINIVDYRRAVQALEEKARGRK